jgi:hypothetical protein
VIVWLPPVSEDVVKLPIPLLSGTVARVDAPSLNLTVPVAVDSLSVAVKVTACPNVDGFRLDASARVVPAAFTVCMRTAEVLTSCVASPLYSAVMLCAPTARVEVVKLALPDPFKG